MKIDTLFDVIIYLVYVRPKLCGFDKSFKFVRVKQEF